MTDLFISDLLHNGNPKEWDLKMEMLKQFQKKTGVGFLYCIVFQKGKEALFTLGSRILTLQLER